MAPRRLVHNIVITDAGFANWQLACGHVYWIWPKLRSSANEIQEVEDRFKNGRPVDMECIACATGNPVQFPLGIHLPTPPPAFPWDKFEDWDKETFTEDVPVISTLRGEDGD